MFWNIVSASEQLGDIQLMKNSLMESLKLDSSSVNIKARMKLCEVAGKLNDFDLIERFAPELLYGEQTKLPAILLLIKAATANFDKIKALSYLSELEKLIQKLQPQTIAFIIHSYLKLNEIPSAERVLNEVEIKYQNELWFKVLLGVLCNYKKDFRRTKQILKEGNINDLPSWFGEKELLFVTLGKAYDQLKDFDNSFNCFELMAKSYQKKYIGFNKYNVVEAYNKLDFNKLKLNKLYNAKSPVFMLGFPRSGTTLLETILDTHKKIETLSEPNTISTVVEEIIKIAQDKDYPQYLSKLTEKDIINLQKVYFECVENALGKPLNSQVFIDKMPLYTVYIPVIKLLFPNAKFIINIRHPLDVILSNFQQNYTLNNEMAFLFSIDDCAKRYQEVMGFLEKMENIYELDSITIRYEDLIENLSSSAKSLFNFLGVKSIPEAEKFYQHAKKKVINTPSSSQVSQPLYQASKYKWKNYQKQLSQYLLELNYFIEKYGYLDK